MVFSYKGEDTNGQKKVVGNGGPAGLNPIVAQDAGPPAEMDSPMTKGLNMDVYYISRNSLPNFFGYKPKWSRTDREINYKPTSAAWDGFRGRNKNFAVRWTGSIIVTTQGSYKFSLQSDDGSKLYVGTARLVSNDGCHGMVKKDGSRTLQSGRTAIRVDYFEKGGGAGIYFKYSGPDTGKHEIIVPQARLDTRHVNRNWREEQFNFNQGRNLPNLAGRKPTRARSVSRINYGATQSTWSGFSRRNDFAVRWTCILKVSKTANYGFAIESDDGSQLFINHVRKIDNNGRHGMRTRTTAQRLNKNKYYNIKVEYFEDGAGAGCKVKFNRGNDNSCNRQLLVNGACGSEIFNVAGQADRDSLLDIGSTDDEDFAATQEEEHDDPVEEDEIDEDAPEVGAKEGEEEAPPALAQTSYVSSQSRNLLRIRPVSQ